MVTKKHLESPAIGSIVQFADLLQHQGLAEINFCDSGLTPLTTAPREGQGPSSILLLISRGGRGI